MLQAVERDVERHQTWLADHEKRLRDLEIWQGRMLVFSGLGAALGAALMNLVVSLLMGR